MHGLVKRIASMCDKIDAPDTFLLVLAKEWSSAPVLVSITPLKLAHGVPGWGSGDNQKRAAGMQTA